jgi:type II secretory pathway pseudopilin PulG
MSKTHSETGFSLIELMVSMGVLMAVSSIVTGALLQMTQSQSTIWNRTEMHSGIRGATELLQQEVGQAGRITFPGRVTLAEAINDVGGGAPEAQLLCDPGTPTLGAVLVGVETTNDVGPLTAVSGMWATPGTPASYISLTTLDGNNQETFRVAAIDGSTTPATIFACFTRPHLAGTVLAPMGGFATGIIPDTGITNPSTGMILKLYGDINGDGNMVYVEYTCDLASGNLYRQVIPYDHDLSLSPKPALTEDDILLTNIIQNPVNPATPLAPPPECFAYQRGMMKVQGTEFTFILDVAIMLTVRTELIDPVTKQFQTETKALLNVSPRNIFAAWSLAGIGYTDRIQSTPVTVTDLLVPLP